MVTIDGVEYGEDDLTQEQKYVVSQIQDIEAKINQVKFQLNQLVMAKQGFTDMLLSSVNESSDAE